MNNCSIAIQVLPQVSGQDKVRDVVDACINLVEKRGYSYMVGPFETTVEGPFDDMMDLIKDITKLAADEGSGQVYAYTRIVYDNTQEVWSIEDKTGKYQR